MSESPRRPRKAEIRRREFRDSLWPDANSIAYDRHVEKGFATIPRTLPIVATLVKELTAKIDASRVYLDLWGRAFDDGLVEIDDEFEFAYACGYNFESRARRTWHERMVKLENLGFIRAKAKGPRRFGYVLLVHPHLAVQQLRVAGLLPVWWLELFDRRIREIGATLPSSEAAVENREDAASNVAVSVNRTRKLPTEGERFRGAHEPSTAKEG
jgi:hypothetical protein